MLSIGELMNLRTDFEDITENFNMGSNTGSCINTVSWFVENGHRSNSLRNGFDYAMEIANTILTEYENGRGSKEDTDC
jgi:hypothetical protein